MDNLSQDKYLSAVRRNWHALLHVPSDKITEEMCLIAVSQNEYAMKAIPESIINEAFIMKVIPLTNLTLKFVKKSKQTPQIVELAMNKNPQNFKYIAKRLMSMEIVEKAISYDGTNIRFVSESKITEQLCNKAYSQNYMSFIYIPDAFKNYEMCKDLVSKRADMLRFVPEELKNDELRLICASSEKLQIGNDENNSNNCLIYNDNNANEMNALPSKDLDKRIINKAKNSWEEFKTFDSNSFSEKNTKKFFKMILVQNSKRTLTEEEKKTIKEIALNIPKDYIQNKKVLKTVYYLKLYDERVVYSTELNKYFVIKEFNGVELDRKSFKNFKKLYKYQDGHIRNIEGIENIDFKKENLENYDLRYSKMKNAIVKKRSYRTNASLTHIENVIDNIQIEDLTVSKTNEINTESISVHDVIVGNAEESCKIYYISDLHLIHKIKHFFKEESISEDDIYEYVEDVVKQLVSSMERHTYGINYSLFFIGGDVSSDFETTKLFYEILSSYINPQRIIAILGNHELWGFDCELEIIVQKYREMFKKLGVVFLHNEALFVEREIDVNYANKKTYKKLSYDDLERLNRNKPLTINKRFCKTSYIILGGLGFSGLDDKFNVNNGIYRDALQNREQDRAESKRFFDMYNNIEKHFENKQVIIFSHTPKDNWSNLPYHKGWIYVNGHTHQNYWEENDDVRVYADNQLGYQSNSYYFKHFYLKTVNYDIFSYYEDGHYKISKVQYFDFCRGLNLRGWFKSDGAVHMLKRSGVYCFFFENYANNKLYLLNGGVKINIKYQDLDYYYNNMEAYAKIIKTIFKTRQDALIKLSSAVKEIGGSGIIHGAIVDIDFYNHIFMNMIDGTITPYYAINVKNKYLYDNVPSLLQTQLPELYDRYLKLLNSGSDNALIVKENVEKMTTPIEYLNTDMYKSSLKMKNIQVLLEKNVIRLWDESLFEEFLSDERLEL